MNILELTLLSNDINETEKFYNGILELEMIDKTNTSISFLTQQSKLTFIKSEIQKPCYHFAFNIPNNKLIEALTWANSKIDIIEFEPNKKIADFENWNAKSFYFYDNNNNIVEFIARFDLDNQSNINFKSTSILSISEIGFAVENVNNQSEKIAAEYNLTNFSKQEKRDDFVVLGNDNGLFIFVERLRTWFPTNKPARKFWTKIKIENNEKVSEITIE